MMGQKHLHELLKEDQEPFLLKNYIFDRRSQLNRPIPKTKLKSKKFRSIVETANYKRSLCNQACFTSFHHGPEVSKSPFPYFPWPATAKSPCNCKSRNTAMLLEAAMRITQKQSLVTKPKIRIKNAGFGLFLSVLQRLRGKNRSRKLEIGTKSDFEMGLGCYCNNSRRTSAVWWVSNERKSHDVETCRSWEEITGSAVEERENRGFAFSENHFCSSPFRLSLQQSPSCSIPRNPNFSSPATSPLHCDKQDNCGIEDIQKIQLEKEQKEKEQCSPVSVLDPPFEDDEGHEDGDETDGYDLECSYAVVQRTKRQLLHKLLRFEKLAELDPIELEKIMLEDQKDEDDNEDLHEHDQQCEDADSLPFSCSKNVEACVRQVLIKSGLSQSGDSVDMQRLVVDLIAEEKREEEGDSEMVLKRVCERLNSWKEVQSNTIDMMVELDYRREIDGWKRNDGELVGETAVEIVTSIFGLMVEELSEEFCITDLLGSSRNR